MLKIWCNAALDDSAITVLRTGLAEHELVLSSARTGNLGATGPDEGLASADIAFGQPDPEQAIALDSLKWVHLTSAGYTRYDRDDLRSAFAMRGAVMTNSSSVYDEPCAQHLLAFMLAMSRQLPPSLIDQLGPKSWAYAANRPLTRILEGDTVLILGYGAIGRRLAELLAPFRLNIVAVRRAMRGDEIVPTYPISDVASLVGSADHIVNILPANDSTDRLIDSDFLARLKQGSRFYNVGRGSTVDQAALAAALQSGRLSGACLDVTDPEPLPSDHFLWSAPNCYITPHIAGGRQEEDLTLVRHFLANFSRFEADLGLVDRIA